MRLFVLGINSLRIRAVPVGSIRGLKGIRFTDGTSHSKVSQIEWRTGQGFA